MKHILLFSLLLIFSTAFKTRQQIAVVKATSDQHAVEGKIVPAHDTVLISINADTLLINQTKFISHVPLLAEGYELAIYNDLENAIGILPDRTDELTLFKAYTYDSLGISIDIYTEPYLLRYLSVHFREGRDVSGPKKSFKKSVQVCGVRMDEHFTLDDMHLLEPYIEETIRNDFYDGVSLSVDLKESFSLFLEFTKNGELQQFSITINYLRRGF